ncbi:MAG: hypothetical protein LBQ50_10875, partial [Planctomycetaceae bacterium]|nr:hypothetical protein [Planctomycetaceae bacterium]
MLPTLYKCPSCWNEFHLEETLWISEELMGDTHFDNADENTRFLPKHFSAKECLARDSEGHACNRLACPHCHLEFPPFYLESQPFMTSIVGSQSSGKTCFLTSLYHWLQTELPNYGINYADGFAKNNERLDEIYKELFPQGSQQNKLVVPSATRLGENDVEI